VANREPISIGMFILAAAFAAIPITLAVRRGVSVAIGPVFVWGCALAISTLVFAVLNLARATGGLSESEKQRLVLAGWGGVLGVLTMLLGFVLPFMLYKEELGKGLDEWRKEWRAVLWPSLAVVGGMLVSFISLFVVRGMERTNQTIRRAVYGFTAVLTSLLLLAVLAIPNVLAYAAPFARFFGKSYDWTRLKVYTLSDETRNFLPELREPIKVYILLPGRSPLVEDVRVLLENFRSINPKISYELVDLSSRSGLLRLNELLRKYNVTTDSPFGLLVLTEAEGKSQYDFVKQEDLTSERTVRRDGTYTFNGENALLNSLKYITESKVVVYFTQGSGELPLQGANPMRPRAQATGLQTIRERLTRQKNLEVRELKLDTGTRKVPDDATLVVIARPTRTVPARAAQALLEWMRAKKGKMVVLLDPVFQGQGDSRTMVPTGLDGLLGAYNVRVNNDWVLNVEEDDPRWVIAATDPESPNPISRAFARAQNVRVPFIFREARTVGPLNAQPGKGPTVEPLLQTYPNVDFWVEKDLSVNPLDKASRLRRDEGLRDKVVAKEPLTIAVTVSEGGAGGMPRDMAHSGLFKDKPRMVVFGNGSWIGDEALRLRPSQADLFTSCLSWLRERPDIGRPPENRERKLYEIGLPKESMTRLLVLPLALMLLGVVGLGTGVWVVRRR
jgi:hypothetical protein